MRAIHLVALVCLACASPPNYAIDRGVSGLWYNPSQSGHGFELTVVSPATIAASWYTYTVTGRPVWVTGLLTEISPGVVSGPVFYYQGMRFGEFDPATNFAYSWGTLKFTFSGCDGAVVDYSGTLQFTDGSSFGAGSIPIQKLVGVQDLACGQTSTPTPATIAGAYSGTARSNQTGQVLDAYVLLEPSGTATLMVPDNAGYFGTYAASGNGISFNLTGQTVAGLVFANGSSSSTVSGTGSARAADFITGTYTGANDSGAYTFRYEGLSTRAASLSAIAGTYSEVSGTSTITATISSAGALTGQDGPCRFSGQFTPIAGINAYNVSVTASSCGPSDGSYAGKAVGTDFATYGDGRALAVSVRGPVNSVTTYLRKN